MTNTQAAMTNTQAASQSPVFSQHRTDTTEGTNFRGCSEISQISHSFIKKIRKNIIVCIYVFMMYSDCTWVIVLFHGLNHQTSDMSGFYCQPVCEISPLHMNSKPSDFPL